MKIGGGGGGHKKRQRVGCNSHLSTVGIIDSSGPDDTFTEASFSIESEKFESDSISAVDSVDKAEVQFYLHSDALRRSKYFAALLFDRWQRETGDSGESRKFHRFNLGVPATTGSINNHLAVELLFEDFSNIIDCASTALSLLPIVLELLFEDCVRACVRFLEAVPWTEEEERIVLSLIHAAIHNRANMAFAKAFVAKLLRDFSSRESARRVLDSAFQTSLKVVKEFARVLKYVKN